jgi:hypothetical protein
MAYVSAEQTEEPVKGEHQFIPAGLPQFKKGKNPLSILAGASVFLQDEGSRVEAFGFKEEEAASVLSAEVETCRQTHEGHVLRQQIDVERCSIIEYRYRHSGKTYTIYLNPQYDLVEDISGPVQTAIENMDALAQKAFDEKRYEDAYRLNLRALCMDEATDAEKGLRGQILKRLTSCYRNVALLIWLVASLSWLLVGASMPKPQFNFGVLLGLIPLLAGFRLFARDTALRFRRRASRLVAAALIGFCGFLSGVAINSNSLEWDKEHHWADWFPLGVVIVAVIAIAIARASERARRAEIEKSIKTFPNAQALETYVCGLDPAGTTEFQGVFALVVSCMLVAGMVGMSKAVIKLERKRLADNVSLEVAQAEEREEAGIAPVVATAQAESPVKATQARPWKNGLGMVFVPVSGTKVLFSVWKTRVRDYAAYAQVQPGVNMEWKNPEFLNKDYKKSGFQQGSTHPVVKISWEDANAFCAWLTKKDRSAGILGENQRYRLPTDAEWSVAVGLPAEGSGTPIEKAERNKNKFIFPWGSGRDQLPPPRGVGNYESTNFDDFEYTSPVWACKPNALGLYDMGGNAYDWCEDEIGSVQHVVDNQMERVLRGGAWTSGVWDFIKSYYRRWEPPGCRHDDNGFRCVLVLGGED